MTPEDARMIADLVDADARATKGPWVVTRMSGEPFIEAGGRGGETIAILQPCQLENAELACIARNALSRLLSLVRAQDAALRLAAVVACAPSARIGGVMMCALAGLRKALDELMPGWNRDGLTALDEDREEKTR